jgi:hypothetical protein
MKNVKKLLKKVCDLFHTNSTKEESSKTLFLLVTRNSDSRHYTITTTSENSNKLYEKLNFDIDQTVVTMPEYISLQKSTYCFDNHDKEVGL